MKKFETPELLFEKNELADIITVSFVIDDPEETIDPVPEFTTPDDDF